MNNLKLHKTIWYTLWVIMLSLSMPILAQEELSFGELTEFEKEFTSFDKDTKAPAVYLYEYGDNYFELRNNYIWLITKYHAKIKVLDKKGFEYADVEIPYYNTKDRKDKIISLRAITHNEGVKSGVKSEEIFETKLNDNWTVKKFTFSNVKEGSILEYTYEMQSPFYFNFTGWKFQSAIPKVYSEFNAKIPGNWIYNRTLIGALNLDVNEATVENYCFKIPGSVKEAGCEVLKYVMKDIPAFDESEEFMLATNNYRSRLEFELSEYKSLYGGSERFTKSWEDVDNEFKSDKDIGSQLRKKNFFEKNVDQDLLTNGDDLTRAKNVYGFVQKHFVWNEEYGIWHDNRVKNAFEEKRGNVAEINIALINLLNAAGIKSNMMLMATRNRGLPKKTHPVMNDFNYIVAKVDIGDASYLLDATDKNLPFGMLPFRCLNYYGRVMDFDKESYWYDIVPEQLNKTIVRVQMAIEPLSQNAEGMFDVINTGYLRVAQKTVLDAKKEEEYIEKMEEEISDGFTITSHELKAENSNDQRIAERFEFKIEHIVQNNTIYLNPFIFKFFHKNPFITAERNYPIDFGYPRKYQYILNLKIPEGYKLKSQPNISSFVLPENLGLLKFDFEQNANGILNLIFSLEVNAAHYDSNIYHGLKDLFGKALKAQNQSLIVLEKV